MRVEDASYGTANDKRSMTILSCLCVEYKKHKKGHNSVCKGARGLRLLIWM